MHGGERGPVTFPAFKAGDSVLRGSNGGFDFHTPPPRFVGFLTVSRKFYDFCTMILEADSFLNGFI